MSGRDTRVGPWGQEERSAYLRTALEKLTALNYAIRDAADEDARDALIDAWFQSESKRLERLYKNLQMPVKEFAALDRDLLETFEAQMRASGLARRDKDMKITGKKNPRPRADSRYFRFVNTIAFDGAKAVINSYSHAPELRASMMKQRKEWAAQYPNAKVRTERMADADLIALVAKEKSSPRANAYLIGQASLAAPAKKPAKKKRVSVTGKKNPAPKSAAFYVLRAHHENGAVYFLTKANKLSTEKKDAERFKYADVDGTLRWLEDRLPKTIKYCDAVKA